jgi:hypothetical protein
VLEVVGCSPGWCPSVTNRVAAERSLSPWALPRRRHHRSDRGRTRSGEPLVSRWLSGVVPEFRRELKVVVDPPSGRSLEGVCTQNRAYFCGAEPTLRLWQVRENDRHLMHSCQSNLLGRLSRYARGST